MLLGQAGAEAALWQGDPARAVRRVDDAPALLDGLIPHQIGGIMLAALGIAAHVEPAASRSSSHDRGRAWPPVHRPTAPRRSPAGDSHGRAGSGRRVGRGSPAAAVHRLAVRAGIRLDDGPVPRVSTPGTLTPRERSVLELVAQGRTNRQVGSELYISEKSVSVHLSRVMGKLGASSRTEAVSVAYARGLLTPRVAP